MPDNCFYYEIPRGIHGSILIQPFTGMPMICEVFDVNNETGKNEDNHEIKLTTVT